MCMSIMIPYDTGTNLLSNILSGGIPVTDKKKCDLLLADPWKISRSS